jgi:ATP-dependent helicase HepA
MLRFFVYHSTFKIGQIVRYDYGTFVVHFLAVPEGAQADHLFDRDAFEDGDLQRIHLPLGTRCRHRDDVCTVLKVAQYIHDMRPAVYEVSIEGRNLQRKVPENELEPLGIIRADPLTMLAGQQQEGYPLFRTRECLAGAFAELVRQGGGLRALLASRIDLRPHQAYVAGVVLQDRLRRYLLADEVGLGKTIEAGIVLQDLLTAQPRARVLILCPGALTYQWLCELYSRFSSRVFTLVELYTAPAQLPEERRQHRPLTRRPRPARRLAGPDPVGPAGGR